MPRLPRKLSPTGIHHIMSRGIDKMMIYHDRHDRLQYMDVLHRVKKRFAYDLYAFCLMGNHNHLLIKETDADISKVMASINIRYSMYYNRKYCRVGAVFQERFRSQPIYDDEHLLVCLRYIHNNPVKAGLVEVPESYRWSSFHDYQAPGKSPLLSEDYILGLFGSSIFGVESDAHYEFIDYDSQQFDENETRKQAQKILAERYHIDMPSLATMPQSRRQEIIHFLRVEMKLSYTNLALVLDMSKATVYRACLRAKK